MNKKFRVWDKENRHWARNNAIPYMKRDGQLILTLDITKDYLVWQQNTGLKDKTGKEIYEGDVLYFEIPGIAHGPSREIVDKAEVWWDEEEGRWAFDNRKDIYYDFRWSYSWVDIDKKTVDIVGNIFENPELLNAST